MCDQQRLRPVCAYAQSDQSLCSSLKYSINIKLLTAHHLEFLSTGSYESIHVKMPHCWKSHDAGQLSSPKPVMTSTHLRPSTLTSNTSAITGTRVFLCHHETELLGQRYQRVKRFIQYLVKIYQRKCLNAPYLDLYCHE